MEAVQPPSLFCETRKKFAPPKLQKIAENSCKIPDGCSGPNHVFVKSPATHSTFPPQPHTLKSEGVPSNKNSVRLNERVAGFEVAFRQPSWSSSKGVPRGPVRRPLWAPHRLPPRWKTKGNCATSLRIIQGGWKDRS